MDAILDSLTDPRQDGRPRTGPLEFRAYLTAVEGLLLPNKPSVPGVSRLNMSLYPRSRLTRNPHLRPPKPHLPTPPKPGP